MASEIPKNEALESLFNHYAAEFQRAHLEEHASIQRMVQDLDAERKKDLANHQERIAKQEEEMEAMKRYVQELRTTVDRIVLITLVDNARDAVSKKCQGTNWYRLTSERVEGAVKTLREGLEIKNTDEELATFIIDNTMRARGNKAAHNATRDEVRAAVERLEDEKEKSLSEDWYHLLDTMKASGATKKARSTKTARS